MARTKRKTNPVFPVAAPDTQIRAAYRTAGYVRLSVEDGGKIGADTMETQKDLLQCYISRQADMELCGLYCDNGQTGTNFERPAFERLMADVKTGEINCIVVKDLSRFGREYKETGNFLERVFPFLGVRFIAVNDRFDTLTAERNEYGFVIPLKNLLNENYSRDISKKISSAIESKEKQGDFIGVWAPYGYRKSEANRHKLSVNEDTAPVIREVFSLRQSGMGYEKIARQLNEQNIPSPSAYLFQTGLSKNEKYRDTIWRAWNIKEILRNPVYLGHLVQGRRTQQAYKQPREERYAPQDEWRIVRNTHDPIVSEPVFNEVQDLASDRKTAYLEKLGKNGSVKTDNLFRGLVYCADCGKALSRTQISSNWHGEKRFYYSFVCLTPRIDPSACTRKNLLEEELIAVVSRQLQCHVQAVTTLEQTVCEAYAVKTEKDRQLLALEVTAAEKELDRQKGRQDGLYQSLVDGIITKQEYALLKDSYLCLRKDGETKLEELRKQKREFERCTPENPMFTILRDFQNMETLTAELLHTFIARIEYGGDNQIKVFFTYQNELDYLKQYAEGGKAV